METEVIINLRIAIWYKMLLKSKQVVIFKTTIGDI